MTGGRIGLTIASDHPAFQGHFPGSPIVPGVLLLDQALYAIGVRMGTDLSACRINALKFLSPVRPGEPIGVRYEIQDNGAIKFDILSEERRIATGSVRVAAVE
jgi:3-hydroxyacyl-[acyl-carrier-protein] dehydratase